MKSAWIGATALAFVSLAAGSSLASATVAADGTPSVYDPWEPTNRALFKFNKVLDRNFIRPSALGYKAALPKTVRTGIGNALNNLGEPSTFINDVLQIRPKSAGITVVRFVINSTVGLAGLIDVAGMNGAPIHFSDFGQTLGHYGVPAGPYVYVPVFGPSDVRDGSGRIIDAFASPLNVPDFHVPLGAKIGVAVLDGVSTRAEYDDTLQDLARTATDEYAALRSAYLQNRRSLIEDPRKAVQQLPDFDAPSGPAASPKP